VVSCDCGSYIYEYIYIYILYVCVVYIRLDIAAYDIENCFQFCRAHDKR
jgi:hypothetical protein